MVNAYRSLRNTRAPNRIIFMSYLHFMFFFQFVGLFVWASPQPIDLFRPISNFFLGPFRFRLHQFVRDFPILPN